MTTPDAKPYASTVDHIWQVLWTPLFQFARRKPSAAALVASADLPAPLADAITRVVRKTRLWPTERSLVAAELVAHFQDGIEKGTAQEVLLAEFGDARLAARLIRRAKLRGRPLWWRWLTRFGHGVLILVGLLVLTYLYTWGRAYTWQPVLKQNYWHTLNAAALRVPPAERAAPRYDALEGRLPKSAVLRDYEDLRPGDPNWPSAVTYCASQRDLVDEIRAIAALPQLGAVLRSALEAREQALAVELPDENPPAVMLILPGFANQRAAAKLLALDARVSASQGDGARAAADLQALLGIARQTQDAPLLIGSLIHMSVAGLASTTLGEVLYDNPSALSDADLIAFAHALAALTPEGRFSLDFGAERACFHDLVQRIFTDEGNGNGVIRPDELLRWQVTTEPTPSGNQSSTLAPGLMLAPFLASRAATTAEYDAIMTQYEREAALPLWERHASAAESRIQALSRNLVARLRYLPVTVFIPALTNAMNLAERGTQTRDATLVAIALELYRREHGDWPPTLDALTPRLLPVVPRDRFDGKPLKYRVVEGHPVLYSVGSDRDDDDGRLPEASPKAKRPSARNREACEWIPPEQLIGPNGKREAVDGDWILWPLPREEQQRQTASVPARQAGIDAPAIA